MLSRLRLESGFLVDAFFMRCGDPGANQPNSLSPHSMNYYQQPLRRRRSDYHETLFVDCMIGIRNCDRKRIAEYRRCLGKSNTVLAKVGGILLRIPFECGTFHSKPVYRIDEVGAEVTPRFLRNRRLPARFRDRFSNLTHHPEVSGQRVLEVSAGFFFGISNGRASWHVGRVRGVTCARWLDHYWVTFHFRFR